jgi:hypothetical protein
MPGSSSATNTNGYPYLSPTNMPYIDPAFNHASTFQDEVIEAREFHDHTSYDRSRVVNATDPSQHNASQPSGYASTSALADPNYGYMQERWPYHTHVQELTYTNRQDALRHSYGRVPRYTSRITDIEYYFEQNQHALRPSHGFVPRYTSHMNSM